MPIAPASVADETSIRQLLEQSGLPSSDLTPELLQHFLVWREGATLTAVIGLELLGDTALLRSLAVSGTRQGGGIGRQMVQAAETLARNHGIGTLYLLTTTAERYFAGLGYRHTPRDAAPPALRATPQFSSLCPASSSFMLKDLRAAA